MAIPIEKITLTQAEKILLLRETHFLDHKSIDILPGKLTRDASSFANSNGGEIYIGITDVGLENVRTWRGFDTIESANAHIQAFEKLFPMGKDLLYEFLQCEDKFGFVLHVHISKTQAVIYATNGTAYIRRGAQKLPCDTPELRKQLEFAKGIHSFEEELVNVDLGLVTESSVAQRFITEVVPTTDPFTWLRKSAFISRRHWAIGHAVDMRFRRWEARGVWPRLWKNLQAEPFAGVRGILLDSTTVRAHPHAAGAPKKTAATRLWVALVEAGAPSSTRSPSTKTAQSRST